MKKRIVTALCIIIAVLALFTSCASDEGETVISYGDASINENIYIFMLAQGKTETLETLGSSTDIPALWLQDMGGGVTFDTLKYLDYQLDMRVKLYFADYALKHDGKLTSAEKKEVVSQVDTIVEQYGSKAALNKYLEAYTMNYDLLVEYYELEALYNKGMALAFTAGGEHMIPISDAQKFYENNYITIKHIAIGTDYAGTDEDGNYIYFTDEEKATRQKLIDEIKKELTNGEDFDKFSALSEDGFATVNPDGYTLTKGVLDSAMSGYEDTAFSLEVGEWSSYKLEGICEYIIKRVPLLQSDFENCYTAIMTSLIDAASTQAALDNSENFVVNQDIINAYNMSVIPILT